MFRNGPEMDGGDIAYLGPTTIIEMTIPMSQSSSDATLDDSGVLAGPHQLPPYSWGRSYFRRAQEYEEFRFSFRTDAHALVGCGEIFFCM